MSTHPAEVPHPPSTMDPLAATAYVAVLGGALFLTTLYVWKVELARFDPSFPTCARLVLYSPTQFGPVPLVLLLAKGVGFVASRHAFGWVLGLTALLVWLFFAWMGIGLWVT